ncbi:MAG: hypothetical protein KAR24_02310 [Candidatus Pacebacteria bacterium]|nr:hypothetical protein [Candidatus Paceibacterota bacterium]
MDSVAKNTQKTVVSIEEDVLRYTLGNVVDEDLASRLKEVGFLVVRNNVVSLIVVDMNNARHFSATARKDWAELLQESKITKTALFGGSRFVKTIASFIIKKAKVENSRVFKEEKDALVWLRSQ